MNPKMQKLINQIRLRAALALDASSIGQPKPIEDTIHVCGRIRVREVSFKNEDEWRYWWLCERDLNGKIIGPARMSEKEKDRYTVAESSNILVAAGVNLLLAYIGSPNGNSTGFAQQLAFGNIPLTMVNPGDTSLAGEFLRIAPSTSSISGTQQDISAFHASGGSAITITNAGLWGVGATGTLGSGTLLTKALLSYVQPAASPNFSGATYDYLLSYI